jgi:hypothetical protein
MSRKFTPPPTKFGPGKPAQPKTPAAPPAATSTHGKHAPPPLAPMRPAGQANTPTAQMKPAGCGCGVNRAAPSVIQASTIGERVRSKHFIEKAPRENMRSVTKAKEELKEMQIEEDEKPKKKKKCQCPGNAQPIAYNWTLRMWNGHSRRPWSLAANALRVGLCVQCGVNAGAELDHVTQFQTHIDNNANAEVFCDGQCHFYGVPIAQANAWYNDVNNLEWLCGPCHNLKPNQQNLAIPPTVLGPCPAGECQGDGCNADHCL